MMNIFNLGFFFPSQTNIDQHTYMELIKYDQQKLNRTCLKCENKPHWLSCIKQVGF